MGDFKGGRRFKAVDLFKVATQSNNSTNTFASAALRIGPPKCWFTRSSNIFGLGCNTSTWAQDWADLILRRGSTAHGTKFYMYGKWKAAGQGGTATLRFTHDPKGLFPIDDNFADNLEATLKLPTGWTSASGTQ